MPTRNIIALMTDYGQHDPYAGVMRGVILGINQNANIVDICHEIAPGDIRSGSFALSMAYHYFPEGSIIVGVVDPGVGTERKGIAALIDGRTYVGPDNGLLTWVLNGREPEKAVELTEQKYFLPEVSHTFHGRDIFAPVAAHLSNGVPIEDLGPGYSDLVRLDIPKVTTAERSLQGEVIYIDHFGSLTTNIRQSDLDGWRNLASGNRIRVNIGCTEIDAWGSTYGGVALGHPMVLFGSAGFLEIAVNSQSAADSFGAGMGTHVTVYHLPD